MQEYVDSKKSDTPSYHPEKLDEFILKSKSRRSTRTWAINNFHESELINIGNKLIESASWAPCSGNRQAWFFKIITKQNEKNLLIGIKEKHCYSAPMLIFIGIDRKAYGAIGINEQGIHVDGAAAGAAQEEQRGQHGCDSGFPPHFFAAASTRRSSSACMHDVSITRRVGTVALSQRTVQAPNRT